MATAVSTHHLGECAGGPRARQEAGAVVLTLGHVDVVRKLDANKFVYRHNHARVHFFPDRYFYMQSFVDTGRSAAIGACPARKAVAEAFVTLPMIRALLGANFDSANRSSPTGFAITFAVVTQAVAGTVFLTGSNLTTCPSEKFVAFAGALGAVPVTRATNFAYR